MSKTFFGNDAEEIQNLFTEFRDHYSKERVLEALDDYEWGRGDDDPKKTRSEVAKNFAAWIDKGVPMDEAISNADAVMQWGFKGQKLPASLGKNTKEFCDLILAWHNRSSLSEMKELLVKNLELDGISIALTSKWLCFVDPKQYAIYDSRVSVTLRKLGKGEGKTFPTTGRRKTKSTSDFPNENYRKSEKMALDYFRFLDLVNCIRLEYGLDSAAEVEMALFMIGNESQVWK